MLADQGRIDEATVEFVKAERLKKDSSVALADVKQLDEALARAEKDQANAPLPALDQPGDEEAPSVQELQALVFERGPRPAVSEPQTAAGFYNRGMEFAKRKELDKAIADFGRVIKLDPKSATAYLVRGEIRLQKKDVEHAMEDFDEAIRLDPQSEAYRARGYAWLSKQQLVKAIDDFSEAIRSAPEDASAALRAWLRLGREEGNG